MEERLNAMDTPFEVDDSSDEGQFVPAKFLRDEKSDPAYILEQERGDMQDKEKLHVAFERLDDRSQDILRSRWLLDDKAVTLQTLAEKYQVSAERIMQLEKNAMQKLKQYML